MITNTIILFSFCKQASFDSLLTNQLLSLVQAIYQETVVNNPKFTKPEAIELLKLKVIKDTIIY